jgi:CTP:molybdopterin cytidylyltransferase MocA
LEVSTTFASLILAGGHSSRMHLPKPWLVHKNGLTFLESIVNLYEECGISNIQVVLNAAFEQESWEREIKKVKKRANLLLNHYPDYGRMFSLQMGLNALKNVDFVYIHNVDNPFTKKEQVIALQTNRLEDGITAPAFQGKGGHPVLISKAVVNFLLKQRDEQHTLRQVFEKFPKIKIEMNNPNILINLNTEAEYKKALREFL